MSIFKKLNEVRKEFLSEKHEKTGVNSFAKYKYFELADFLPSTLMLFAKHGLTGVFSADRDIARLTVFDADGGKEKIEFTCPFGRAELKGCHDVQNIGACITYTRRYLWSMAMELIENDAIDCTPPKEKATENKPVNKDRDELMIAITTAPTIEVLRKVWVDAKMEKGDGRYEKYYNPFIERACKLESKKVK